MYSVGRWNSIIHSWNVGPSHSPAAKPEQSKFLIILICEPMFMLSVFPAVHAHAGGLLDERHGRSHEILKIFKTCARILMDVRTPSAVSGHGNFLQTAYLEPRDYSQIECFLNLQRVPATMICIDLSPGHSVGVLTVPLLARISGVQKLPKVTWRDFSRNSVNLPDYRGRNLAYFNLTHHVYWPKLAEDGCNGT